MLAPGGKTAQLLDNDLVIDVLKKIRIDPEFLKKTWLDLILIQI